MIRSTVVRARRERRCDDGMSGCLGVIRPGDTYARSVASPHHDDYGNEGWLTYACCLACARHYPATWPTSLLDAVTTPAPDAAQGPTAEKGDYAAGGES